MKQRQTAGFTLLEILLVILLMAGIGFLTLNQYQKHRMTKNVEEVQRNVAVVSQALTDYYRTHCQADQDFTVTFNNLKNAGLIPAVVEQRNPLIQYYQVSAVPIGKTTITGKRLYQLRLTLMMNIKDGALQWYKDRLGATLASSNPNMLTWTFIPGNTSPQTDTGQWVMMAGLQMFKEMMTTDTDNSCPG